MLPLAVPQQTALQRSVVLSDDQNAWAIVLAAGEGSRLKALTMTPAGVHVPKQFCSLRSGPSLVHEALRRGQSFAPRQRICTIVAAQHRRWWESLPGELSAANVVVQPQNRGTANGILLALSHIAKRDRNARIVLLPADHYVQDESTLAVSLRFAVAHLRVRPDEILLLGVAPDGPDPELGYIVPGTHPWSGTFEVVQFVEKPTVPRALELIQTGALWNAFIVAATAQAMLDLFERRFPEIVKSMRDVVRRDYRHPGNPVATVELYECLPSLDFSRDVIGSGRDANLRVLPVPHCGWSDLGTRRRLAETLRQVWNSRRAGESSFGTSTQLSLAAGLEGLEYTEMATCSTVSANPS